MAELATIARPYAEALFKAAVPGDAGAQLDALAAVAADERLRQFADDPRVDGSKVFQVVMSVVPTPLSDALQNFLRTVIDNGRLAALPEIATQYRVLASERSGVRDAVIHSAYPIDAGALPELVAALERRFGGKLNASVQVDPALIGGVRVVVGDEVLDTSVKARLEQMKVALTS